MNWTMFNNAINAHAAHRVFLLPPRVPSAVYTNVCVYVRARALGAQVHVCMGHAFLNSCALHLISLQFRRTAVQSL